MARTPLVLLWLFGFTASASSQTIRLAESTVPGNCFRVELSLAVSGKLKVQLPGGKAGSESLEAIASHVYTERVESENRAVRYYTKATATSVIAGAKQVRELSAPHRLIVARPPVGVPQHFNPDSPLTREELELVSEHFDSLLLPRLLPGKDVAPGESWKIPDAVAKAACFFEELTVNTLEGKLIDVQNGVAEFAVEGSAEGTELGAAVKVRVTAKGRFDLATKRVVSLTWSQEDDRGQGPASPAAELKATVKLKREALAAEPDELNAAARAKVPAGAIPESLLQLRYTEPAGKYSFLHSRGWHVTGQVGEHLVLRLVENGDWIAQANILSLKPPHGANHMTPAAFKDAIAKQPGWEPAGIAADGELPTGPGRWLYRVAAVGKQDGLAVVQAFFCLSDAAGNQVVVTVIARDDRAAKLGTRDVALVNAIEFPGKK
ncbi:MAG TPA: hypothetical protein VGJ05_10000 [Fimbriiglobus sp.]|jgi:hypothetical protein